MRHLGLYLFRQLSFSFVFATVAVTCVVLFTQLFRLLSIVINNSATILVFAQMLALSVPTFLPLVLPLALGIATLFSYHRLATDSELVVMGSAGISPTRLAMPALALGGIVTCICFALTLSLAPEANRDLVALQYKVRDNFAVLISRPGSFNDIADGFTFFARQRLSDGSLAGILMHDVRRADSPITIMADTGQVIANNGQPQMVVYNGRRQELNKQTGKLSELAFEQYVIDLNAVHNSPTQRLADPREQTVGELLNPSDDMLRIRTTRAHLLAELHQRLASPLLTLSYLLIGLSAMLAGEFNRRGIGQRIILASLAIVIIQATFMSLSNLIVQHANLAVVLYLAAIIPGVTCFYLIKGNWDSMLSWDQRLRPKVVP